jgi:hypothetical protein
MSYRMVPRTRREILVLSLGSLVLGCTQDQPAPVRMAGAPVEIDPDPELSIGAVAGSEHEELYDVGAPALLPDGSIVVPLSTAGELRIFGPDGEHRRSHGGRGGGPGEFDYLSGVWVRGDTIEAWDASPPRITRFFPDGSLETVPFDYEGPLLSALVGGLSDGWLVNSVASAGIKTLYDLLLLVTFRRLKPPEER